MKRKNVLIQACIFPNSFLLFILASFVLLLSSGCYPQVPAQTPTEPTAGDSQPGVEITEDRSLMRG